MHQYRLAALAAITGFASGSAVLPSQPKQTGQFVFPLDQVSPRPTSRPESPLELMRRQNEKTTVQVAPDNICGYISDRPGASFYCPALYNCILFTAETTFSGAVACCNTDACNLRLTCLDYDQVMTSSACDNGCLIDPFTLKCTDTKLPYCNTASFPGSIYDYWCNDASISTAQKADTTYSGQTGRSFSDLVLDDATTASRSGSGGLDFVIKTSAPPDESATPPVVDDGGNDGGDQDADGGDGGGGGSKKKSNTGAIAGGVVGGVAAIGLLGAGAFLLMRKKRKQDATSAAAANSNGTMGGASTFPPTSPMTQHNTPPPMGYGGGGMAPQHQSVYDPNYAQQMQGQQMQGQYGIPPPGSVYPPKQDYVGYYNQAPGQQGMMAVAVDRNDSTSPMSDANRLSNQPLASPALSQTSGFMGQGYAPGQQYPQQQQQQGYQQTQPTIHEAGGRQVDHHRGQMHELGS